MKRNPKSGGTALLLALLALAPALKAQNPDQLPPPETKNDRDPIATVLCVELEPSR